MPDVTLVAPGLGVPRSVQAREHASELLRALQANGCGDRQPARWVRDDAYPAMCERMGWARLPWHGRNGVGRHLARLCGGRPIVPDEVGKPVRCYALPGAVVQLDARRA
jgi:hypothetical protein